jgi:Ca-activated chloride channel family protein
MKKPKKIALAMGLAMLMVGMSFATMIGGADDETLPPSVTKTLSTDTIYFGSTETETTVTIEVTGDGGTSSTITPMDVVFAIDSSGSMGWNDPSDLRLSAAKGFVDNMDDSRDTGGVVSWDSDIDFTFGLSDDFDDTDGLKYEIDQVGASGGTNLNVGLYEAVSMLDANTRVEDSVEVIIFLTDGQGLYTDADDGGPADDAADEGYIIFSIGLNIGVNSTPEANLMDMADATGGAYYSSANASNLQAIYDAIFDEIVTSTIPHNVDVCEILEEYIVLDTTSFNIAPDSITYNLDGTTTIKWLNVGQYVGDNDAALDADETVTLTFDVGADKAGYMLPVQVLPGAKIVYDDSDGVYAGMVPIPQAYLNVVFTADFIADGGSEDTAIVVGEIFMWQDANNYYVKFVTTGDWYMTLTHLHVADDAADIPQTKKGNPQVGKFDYETEHSPAVQEYTYTIPWSVDWESGTTLYTAAHANVQMLTGYDDEGDPVYRMETAWGDGCEFGGNSWATYSKYVDP